MIYQILALTIWGSSLIAAKFAYTMMDAAVMVQIRLLIAALLVLPSCRRYIGKIPCQHWKTLLWVSFVSYDLILLLQFIGVKYTSAASAVTVIGLEPLLMVFCGHFFFHDKAKPYHWVCGALAFAGIAVMVMGGSEEGGEVNLFGCLLAFLASVAFCFVMRPTQKLIQEIGAPAFTSVSLAVSAVMCLPFSLLLAENYQIDWNWQGSLAVLYLGVCCSWLAFRLWNKGISLVPANISGLLTALEPVLGVMMAVLVLGERVSAVSATGIAMVIVSTLSAAFLSRQTT